MSVSPRAWRRVVAALTGLFVSLTLASPASAQQSTVDLLSQFQLRIDGPSAVEISRRLSVEAAGDVNGDGRPDVVVGIPTAGPSGTAYVVFGRSAPGTIDLAALGAGGFRIAGDHAIGGDVAGAGDVNGDGLADLVIGAPGAGAGGRAYIVFGKASTSPVDVAALGAGGFRIDGRTGFNFFPLPPPGAFCRGDEVGTSVDGVGDFNGDGRPDVVIAGPGPFAPSLCVTQGSAYVVFGKASTATVDLADPQGAAVRLGDGTNAAGAGDVNGDGRPDIVVGTSISQRPGSGASVHFAGGGGFAILGEGTGDAVAGVGDMNGDGRGDVAVGDPDASNNGRPSSGSAWVVFGQASTTAVDLGALGTGGFRIDGARGGDPGLGDQLGFALDGAGDVNGDGRPDVLAGAPRASNNGRYLSGSAYVVFGRSATTTVDLAALGEGGLRIDGARGGTPPVPPNPGAVGDLAGSSVAGAGDMTGDGRPDVLVGAPSADNNGRNDSGSAYLVSFRPADTVAPVLRVPRKVKAKATSPNGANVSYTVTATDDTDTSPTIRCVPPSGSSFRIGRTTVTCTATDDAGNVATASFVVKVKRARRQIRD